MVLYYYSLIQQINVLLYLRIYSPSDMHLIFVWIVKILATEHVKVSLLLLCRFCSKTLEI
jgi:hypothetical protein